jgi:hypothetical protein
MRGRMDGMSISRFVFFFVAGPAWSVWWLYRGISEQRWVDIVLGGISLICFAVAGVQMARSEQPTLSNRSE